MREADDAARLKQLLLEKEGLVQAGFAPNPKARVAEEPRTLAARVMKFIREAQVNYRNFFSTTDPDLFPRILERLTSGESPAYTVADLKKRLERVNKQDKEYARFGMQKDKWDYQQIVAQLEKISHRTGDKKNQALTVLGSYLETLESRAAERALVADRLESFERLISDFFTNKTIRINSTDGLIIETEDGQRLNERQLSSGEFHLLFLMVAALVTKRRGTVIAIDEPEMSMHIAWQRRLIPALLECASKAQPLFIFATHSPDLAASYPDAVAELS
jgi:predicted ATPase